jgi:hypothetical protein
MSILGGLISSAAKGLQGGAEAVSALGKAGIEKQIKIDLAKETADIEFQKNSLLKELESKLRNEEADLQMGRELNLKHVENQMNRMNLLDPEIRDFNLDIEKKKSKIITPLQQQQIETSKSDNAVKQFELKLLTDSNTAYEDYLKEKNKANPDQTKLKQLENRITLRKQLDNITQRAKNMTDLVVNINRMFANDQNLINTPEGKDLMKDLPNYIKEAARLSGYEGPLPSINTNSGSGNNGLVNTERNNPDINKLLKEKPSQKNFNILKDFTYIDENGRKYKLTDFDDKTDPPSYGQEFIDEEPDSEKNLSNTPSSLFYD